MKLFIAISLWVMCFFSYGQQHYKIPGQFNDLGAARFKSISIHGDFLEKSDADIPVNEFGFFNAVITAREYGLCMLAFGKYSFELVLGADSVMRLSFSMLKDSSMDIVVEDSPENDAYRSVRKFLTGQYLMYTYYPKCKGDSCLIMLSAEQDFFRHNMDSLRKKYPGTYAMDVLSSFYYLKSPSKTEKLNVTVAEEFLNGNWWNKPEAYNNKTINKVVDIYMQYARAAGVGERQLQTDLLAKTSLGSVQRHHLANTLFNVLSSMSNEKPLNEFMLLAKENADLLSDPVLREKCKAMAKTMAGQPAPEISSPDTSGKKLSLRAEAAKNPLTLLFIWNPDCSHCIESLPTIKSEYEKFHAKGLQIFAVSLGDERAPWISALHKFKCNWINVQVDDESRFQPEEYFVTHTPTLVLIDKQGLIVKRDLAVDELDKALTDLLH